MVECWNNGKLGLKVGKSFYEKRQNAFKPMIPIMSEANQFEED